MSGSSGSGDMGFGGSAVNEVSCERLVIETPIASPKPDVIVQLKVGDTLVVGLEEQSGTMVIVLFHNHQKAGGIASSYSSRLRTCLQQGTQYSATVISINGGSVQVRIRAVR